MGGNDASTLLQMLRADPVEVGLLLVAPFVVAVVQLLNSFVNDLSLAVSVPFAVTVLAFAGVAVQYRLAQYRLTELESFP